MTARRRKVYHDDAQGWCWASPTEALCFSQFPSRAAARQHAAQYTTTKSAGRPTLTGETLTVQQVRLTAAQIATARRLGAGNLSAGVRAALDAEAAR
jgi:hypothetical protein